MSPSELFSEGSAATTPLKCIALSRLFNASRTAFSVGMLSSDAVAEAAIPVTTLLPAKVARLPVTSTPTAVTPPFAVFTVTSTPSSAPLAEVAAMLLTATPFTVRVVAETVVAEKVAVSLTFRFVKFPVVAVTTLSPDPL